MPKLSMMNLPKHSMEYCEKCKEYVPSLDKHNFKRHSKFNTKKLRSWK